MTERYSYLIASANEKNTELLNNSINLLYGLSSSTLEKGIVHSGKVFFTNESSAAINLILNERPDFIYIDDELNKFNNLIKKIRDERSYDRIFITLIIQRSDLTRIEEVFSLGVDDILILPLNQNDIVTKLINAHKLFESRNNLKEMSTLLTELADELRNSIEETKLLALKCQELRIPYSFEISKRIARASVWIAREMGENDEDTINDIEIAAKLSYIGKLSLPDDLLNLPVHQSGLVVHKLMYQVPVVASQLLSQIKIFTSASKILFHLYENLDGSGFPEKLRLWQIPLGSRIIRVVQDYEVIRQNSSKLPKEILSILKKDIRRLYDHRIVILLEQYIKTIVKEDYDPNETAIYLKDLKEGMFLTQDIITNVGLKLMSAGSRLTQHHIETIISHNTTDPVIGKIFVKKQ